MKKRNILLGVILASVSFGSVLAAVTNYSQVISMEKAEAIAKSKVPGATITSIELDYGLRGPIYDIEMYLNSYEYDLKLNATTGAGISIHKEYENHRVNQSVISNNLNQTEVSKTTLTANEAQVIALQQVPNAEVEKIELDMKHGQPVYEVELRKGYSEYDVEIDAITGTVLQCKIED